VRGFEYPRRELPSTVRFIGPIAAASDGVPHPPWWNDLDGSRPVVHVTQGTLANADATRLLIPTIAALADDDVLVVASTGGRDTAAVRTAFGERLPANARTAAFLPYDELLERTDVMVTNGGYGGVQRALAHGVPLVVAGASEDKPEVAARVSWSGAGINLRTGSPSVTRIRTAVRTVLDDPAYRQNAIRLEAETAALADPVGVVVAHLEANSSSLVNRSWGTPAGR
jgi:UDP:flavonoid glycosyltransferase YjiC (YdhE family)